jgi:hypothetical protein
VQLRYKAYAVANRRFIEVQKMRKGQHQRPHRRTSLKGRHFAAGKGSNLNWKSDSFLKEVGEGFRMLNKETYSNLDVTKYTKKYEIETYGHGYKYLITNHSTAHTAFRTDAGFRNFLKTTGVRLGKALGWPHLRRLNGTYHRITFAGNAYQLDKYAALKHYKPTKVLDNGRYTRGYYGNGNIILLNPNYQRVEYPYFYE